MSGGGSLTPRVEKLERPRLQEAAGVLAAAFQEDPMYSFVIPNAAHRRRWLPIFKRQILATLEPHGHCYVALSADGKVTGVLALTPPGHYPHSSWSDLKIALTAILRPTPWCPNLRKLWPIRKYAETFDEIHYKPPHWYIDVIGVDPARQRQGIGQSLMRRVIELASATQLPIWLETQTESNVPYYQALGFELTVTRHPAAGGPPTWGMLRGK